GLALGGGCPAVGEFARAFLLLLPYGRQLLATIGVRDRAGGGEEAPGRFVAAVEVAGAALANWGGAQARRGAGVVEDIAAAGAVMGESKVGCRGAGFRGDVFSGVSIYSLIVACYIRGATIT